jgi:hypothetical protein
MDFEMDPPIADAQAFERERLKMRQQGRDEG